MEITKEMLASVPFQYAAAVKAGHVTAGHRVKQAVDRFYTWIEEADKKGFYLDHNAGLHIIDFFPYFLIHTKGKSTGQPFVLSPFQQFTLYNVFAWKQIKYDAQGNRADTRRINEVYEKIAKKNGKTAVMAGVALYHLAFDEEPGAEVYVGATKEDQARLCFNQASEFITASPRLRAVGFTNYQRTIKNKVMNSFMKPLGGDSKTQDGINCSFGIMDEYHGHKDDSIKENVESSQASRKQPLLYHITTAGVNIASVCRHYEEMAEGVLDGLAVNEHLFIMIHDLDQGDDWQDKTNWEKSNPNLGVTVSYDFLEKEFNKVVNQPSKIPNFKTKHLNQWVDAPEIWIPTEIWERNRVTVDDYQALFREKAQKWGCYSGTDLSTRTDLSAHVLITEPDEQEERYIMPFIFCPKDTIDRRSKEDRVPYRYWADQGYLTATPGDTVDYDEIEKKIVQNNHEYNVINNEFDSWNATTVVNNLQAQGLDNITYFSQAIGNINHPTKAFELMTYQGKLKHDGNPVLSWNLSGCVIYQDANENIKVHKGRSNAGVKRVDGIVASIMALGGSLSQDKAENNQSKYNDPGVSFSFGIAPTEPSPAQEEITPLNTV